MSQNRSKSARLANCAVMSRRILDRVLARMNLAERAQRTAFIELRQAFYREFWRKAVADIGGSLEDLGGGYRRLTRGDRTIFIHSGWFSLDSQMSYALSDNKPVVLGMLREMGIATTRYCECEITSQPRAETFMREIGGKVVVKPANGPGSGFGVTTGIQTSRSLKRAMFAASRYDTKLLIEKEVVGSSFRLLYLGGELIDVVRRDGPSIEGDGRQTVAQLVAAENARRLSADPIVAVHPITLDADAHATLAAQGWEPGTVLATGTRAVVKQVVNQNADRDNHRVHSQIHPSIVEDGRRLAAAVNLKLAGVDVMTTDITIPLAASGGCINEVNAGPGLHHHVLVAESDKVPVGALALEYALANAPQAGDALLPSRAHSTG